MLEVADIFDPLSALVDDEIAIERDEDRSAVAIAFVPEGHVHPLRFHRKSHCGRANNGLHVSGYDECGGVMTKAQMIALRDLLNLSIAEAVN